MTPAKPIRSFRLRSGGRCGCTACLNDERRSDQMREAALAAIAHDLAQTDGALAGMQTGAVVRTTGGYQ